MSAFIPNLIRHITSSINNSYELPDNSFFNKEGYKSRDIIHEKGWKDRLLLNKIGDNYSINREIEKILKRILFAGHSITYYNYLHDVLEDEESKNILIEVVCLRIMGAEKFKLSMENESYQRQFSLLKECKSDEPPLRVASNNWLLNRYDFCLQNENVSLYYTGFGVVTTFFVEQYALRRSGFYVRDRDVILDCGGCWGDTAVYFAKAARDTRVYAFEFVPSNIELFNKNVNLNNLSNVELIRKPVSEFSGDKFYVLDNGPASRLSKEKLSEETTLVDTLSIDDFCTMHSDSSINFIKMDIEGAELLALKGAIETIKKFKPRLAIALYHNEIDFLEIPKFINELGVGYEFHLGHFTPTTFETILFAQVKNDSGN